MYIFVSSFYPSDKATEVGKKYLEVLQKYPPDQTLGSELVPAAVKTTECGIKVLNIVEVKKGKLEEALNRAINEMAMFLSIVGFEYSIDVHLSAAEAMATIGMSLPG